MSNPAAPPTDPRTIKDNYTFTPYQLAKNLRREDVLVCLDPRVRRGEQVGRQQRGVGDMGEGSRGERQGFEERTCWCA